MGVTTLRRRHANLQSEGGVTVPEVSEADKLAAITAAAEAQVLAEDAAKAEQEAKDVAEAVALAEKDAAAALQAASKAATEANVSEE